MKFKALEIGSGDAFLIENNGKQKLIAFPEDFGAAWFGTILETDYNGKFVGYTAAKGAYLIDADGQSYIDYVGSWGPMILGHEGAGIVVLEEYERAVARGATIYAEVTGYGANADGYDMVAPSGEGAQRCMKIALEQAGNPKIDYLNPHGTSTPVGDSKEMGAVRNVFGDDLPMISSTKSLTGHSLGAAGAQEAIYCLLMMQNGFAAESAHIENLDPAFEGMPILRQRHDGEPFDRDLPTLQHDEGRGQGAKGRTCVAADLKHRLGKSGPHPGSKAHDARGFRVEDRRAKADQRHRQKD